MSLRFKNYTGKAPHSMNTVAILEWKLIRIYHVTHHGTDILSITSKQRDTNSVHLKLLAPFCTQE